MLDYWIAIERWETTTTKKKKENTTLQWEEVEIRRKYHNSDILKALHKMTAKSSESIINKDKDQRAWTVKRNCRRLCLDPLLLKKYQINDEL